MDDNIKRFSPSWQAVIGWLLDTNMHAEQTSCSRTYKYLWIRSQTTWNLSQGLLRVDSVPKFGWIIGKLQKKRVGVIFDPKNYVADFSIIWISGIKRWFPAIKRNIGIQYEGGEGGFKGRFSENSSKFGNGITPNRGVSTYRTNEIFLSLHETMGLWGNTFSILSFDLTYFSARLLQCSVTTDTRFWQTSC